MPAFMARSGEIVYGQAMMSRKILAATLFSALLLGTALPSGVAYAQVTDQTDQSEEDWRKSRKKRTSSTDYKTNPIKRGSSGLFGGGTPVEIDPVERLPSESRRHIMRERAKAIANSPDGDISDAEYKPSEAAKTDDALKRDEMEAWKEVTKGGKGKGKGTKMADAGGSAPVGLDPNGGGSMGGTPGSRGGSSGSLQDILDGIKNGNGSSKSGNRSGGQGGSGTAPGGASMPGGMPGMGGGMPGGSPGQPGSESGGGIDIPLPSIGTPGSPVPASLPGSGSGEESGPRMPGFGMPRIGPNGLPTIGMPDLTPKIDIIVGEDGVKTGVTVAGHRVPLGEDGKPMLDPNGVVLDKDGRPVISPNGVPIVVTGEGGEAREGSVTGNGSGNGAASGGGDGEGEGDAPLTESQAQAKAAAIEALMRPVRDGSAPASGTPVASAPVARPAVGTGTDTATPGRTREDLSPLERIRRAREQR